MRRIRIKYTAVYRLIEHTEIKKKKFFLKYYEADLNDDCFFVVGKIREFFLDFFSSFHSTMDGVRSDRRRPNQNGTGVVRISRGRRPRDDDGGGGGGTHEYNGHITNTECSDLLSRATPLSTLSLSLSLWRASRLVFSPRLSSPCPHERQSLLLARRPADDGRCAMTAARTTISI